MYRLGSVALTVAILFVAVSGTAMASGPDADDIASAKKVRETFGLRADTVYVRSSLTEPGRFLSTDWGVPLSSAELDDMVARLEVQASLPPAIGYAAKQSSYGGAYIDQQDGGLPVFLFTEKLETHRQAIGQRLPADTKYGVRIVEHSLAQLTALKDLVSDRRKILLDESDVEVVSSSVDVVQNRVIVGIYAKNERRTDSVKSLGEPMVVFDVEVPVTDACEIDGCNNIKGGLVITQGGWYPAGTECTSGFIAKETNPSRYVMVTAGHCVADNVSPGSRWKYYKENNPNGTAFGDEIAHSWQNDALADVGVIEIESAQVPPNKNTFLAHPAQNTTANINGTLSFSQQIKGLQVCRIGWGSWEDATTSHYAGRKCGLISLFDSDSNGTNDDDSKSCAYYGGSNHCRYIKDMKVVNFDSWGGDSGGIVFEHTWPADNPTKLLGTHVHSKSTVFTTEGGENALRGWYSPVGKAVTELASRNVTISPCTTAGC